MNNIRGFAVVSDGAYKRIAITFDVISDDGTVIAVNKRINRIITDSETNMHIKALETFAQDVIDAETAN